MPTTVSESSEGAFTTRRAALGGRPVGVVVAAAIYVVGALYGLASLAAAGAATFLGGFFWNFFGSYPFPGGAGFTGAQILGLAVAYGLWMSYTWAWYSVVILSVISVWGSFALFSFTPVWAIVGIVIGALLVWYFLAPHVQAAFRTGYNVPWKYPKLP